MASKMNFGHWVVEVLHSVLVQVVVLFDFQFENSIPHLIVWTSLNLEVDLTYFLILKLLCLSNHYHKVTVHVNPCQKTRGLDALDKQQTMAQNPQASLLEGAESSNVIRNDSIQNHRTSYGMTAYRIIERRTE